MNQNLSAARGKQFTRWTENTEDTFAWICDPLAECNSQTAQNLPLLLIVAVAPATAARSSMFKYVQVCSSMFKSYLGAAQRILSFGHHQVAARGHGGANEYPQLAGNAATGGTTSKTPATRSRKSKSRAKHPSSEKRENCKAQAEMHTQPANMKGRAGGHFIPASPLRNTRTQSCCLGGGDGYLSRQSNHDFPMLKT